MKRVFILTSTNLYAKRRYFNSGAVHQKLTDNDAIDACEQLGAKMDLANLTQSTIQFHVNGDQIRILQEPSEFYNTLLEKCRKATRRIVLVSLYLGTGKKESVLVTEIQQRLSEIPDLSVRVLLDCTRGSRGKNNSRTMLLSLLQQYPSNCQVSLYRTPKLRGLLKLLLPNRYNEVLGVQHMKLYLFDDDLIISGANLSDDYFTNRQDRYMVVSNCRPLGDFVANLTERVSDFSFRLSKDNELSLDWPFHPTNSRPQDFIKSARSHVWDYYCSNISPTNTQDKKDTTIFPLLEMGQLDLHQESIVTEKLLNACPSGSQVRLATGYFNITQGYADSVVQKSQAQFTVLMAHPQANGFYEAKGPAGGIPKGYSELAGRFYDQLNEAGQQKRVQLFEYLRNEWTFHAKGLWFSDSPQTPPSLTLVGSSNFGERSVHKDLECQFLIATSNAGLQRALYSEAEHLLQFGRVYGEDERSRKPPLWVKIALFLFKKFL